MGLSTAEITQLRCLHNELTALFPRMNVSGATVENPDGTMSIAPPIGSPFTVVSATGIVDGIFVTNFAAAAGWLTTWWELVTLRATGRYPLFDAVYDSLVKLSASPSVKNVLALPSTVIGFIVGSIQLQQNGAPCSIPVAVMPGLSPPDSIINDGEVIDRDYSPIASGRVGNKTFGWATAGAVVGSLAGLAVIGSRHG